MESKSDPNSKHVMADQVLFYRLWAGVSPDLPLERFDNLVDSQLEEVLIAQGLSWVQNRYGSQEGWHAARAEREFAKYERRARRASGQPTRPGRAKRKTTDWVEVTPEGLAAEAEEDERPMLLQLLEETTAIQEARGLPVSRIFDGPTLAEVISDPVYFFRCSSHAEGACAYLQLRAHDLVGIPETLWFGSRQWPRDSVTVRFGFVDLDALSDSERIDALMQVEDSRVGELWRFAERTLHHLTGGVGPSKPTEEEPSASHPHERGADSPVEGEPTPGWPEAPEPDKSSAPPAGPLTQKENAILTLLQSLPPDASGHPGVLLSPAICEGLSKPPSRISMADDEARRHLGNLKKRGLVENKPRVGYWAVTPGDGDPGGSPGGGVGTG